MPQAVSRASSASSARSSGSISSARSRGDGSSFENELDQARDTQSKPAVSSDGKPAAADSSTGGKQPVGKKTRQKQNDALKPAADAAPQKTAAKIPVKAEQPDTGDATDDSQTPTDPQDDQSKKSKEDSSPSTTTIETTAAQAVNPAAATVQISQAAAAAQTKQPASSEKPAPAIRAADSGRASARAIEPSASAPEDSGSDSASAADATDSAATDSGAAVAASSAQSATKSAATGRGKATQDSSPASTQTDVTSTTDGSEGVQATVSEQTPAEPDATSTDSSEPVAAPSAGATPAAAKSTQAGATEALTAQQPVSERGAPAHAGSTNAGGKTAPEVQFARTNYPQVVAGIHGKLLPSGGTMSIRLDPPELGAMQIKVEVRDGAVTAAFETSNDQATRLLSHSLGDLKTALEAQGVSIQKLHVSQTARPQSGSSGDEGRSDQNGTQDQSAQREQQRREMMRRMWNRLMNGADPLDLVA